MKYKFLCAAVFSLFLISLGIADSNSFIEDTTNIEPTFTHFYDGAQIISSPQNIETPLKQLQQEKSVNVIIETDNGIQHMEDFVNQKYDEYRLGGQLDMLIIYDTESRTMNFIGSCSSFNQQIRDIVLKDSFIKEKLDNDEYDKAFPQMAGEIYDYISNNRFSGDCGNSAQSDAEIGGDSAQQENQPFIQTYGCIYGNVQKPDIIENIINDKPRKKITPTDVVVHFTGRASLDKSLQSLVDRDLVVQFMVDKDGTIYQLMPDIETLSSGAKCANKNSISMEIVGINEQELLSNEVQFQSVSDLVKWLSQEYDIDLLQQKASSPQSGILGHSEVDLECPSGTGKFDPGPLYMAKLRTNLCKRSMLFDLTVDASKPPTKDYLRQNKIALEKLNQLKNSIHIILAGNTPDKNYIDSITGDSISPDCTIVMNKGISISLSTLPMSCTLADAEIKNVEENLQAPVQLSDAVFEVASDVSDKIDNVNQQESLIADASNFVFEENTGFLNPTACATCSEETPATGQTYAQHVLSSASGLSTTNINRAYEAAKLKYMAGTGTFLTAKHDSVDFSKIKETNYAVVKSTTDDRIKTWSYYIFPQIFPEKVNQVAYSNTVEYFNTKSHDFNIIVYTEYQNYHGSFVTFSSFYNTGECGYKVFSSGQLTKETKDDCAKDFKVSVGTNGDCRDKGSGACVVIIKDPSGKEETQTFSIRLGEFTKDCSYKVISNGAVTKSENIFCGFREPIKVGTNGDCRDEGIDTCVIITANDAGKIKEQKYSISFKEKDIYVYGEEFHATPIAGWWNCRLQVESGGAVTRDQKIACPIKGDNYDYTITIGADGDCKATGSDACKIIFSEGYIFKNYKTYVISVYTYLNDARLDKQNAEIWTVDTKIKTKVETVLNALYSGIVTASSNKYHIKVSPEEVYTIAVGEGLNDNLHRFYTNPYTYDLAVSGFSSLGTDVIGSEIGTLKAGGFVSNRLKIETEQQHNEKNEIVTSGNFDNLNDAFEGVAGTIAYRKYLFFRDLQSMGVNPSSISRKQVNFWLYMYYNPGPGAAKNQLRKFVHDGILDDASYINVKPNEQISNGRVVRNNAIIRAVMMETMYNLGVLNLPGYSDAYGQLA